MKDNKGLSVPSPCEAYVRASRSRLGRPMSSSLESDNNWMISFSDVMSLLLVFFIMFLVMTKGAGGNEKAGHDTYAVPFLPYGAVYQPDVPSKDVIGDEIVSAMNSLNLGDDLTVRAANREIMITIQETITFRPGEAEMLGSFEPVLDHLASVIQKYPFFQVEIIGHTDNVPIHTSRYPSNWELSVARAAGVLAYFIKDYAIDPSRLSIKGNADHQPVATNDTPEDRARNRRVEIRLTRTEV